MPYNIVANSFNTKKLRCRLSSSKVRFYTENGRFAFWTPLGDLGVTYDDHLRLIGKRVVNFLLVLIELFRPHQQSFFSETWAKSFVWYKNLDRSFFRFVTIYAFDKQRDRRTGSFLVASPRWHSMQREKKHKNTVNKS